MFQIPSGEDSINYFYRLLMDNFEIKDSYIVTEFKYNLSMRLFDMEKQEWDLRWENWAIWLKTFLYEQEYEVLFPEGIKDDDKKIDFDLTDLEIITVLSSDMRMSYDEISRRLKKPKTTLYHKAKRILDNQVLFPFVHLAQIGLNENIVIEYTGKEDFVKALESALFEMPKVYIYNFKSLYGREGIHAWLELPNGSIGRLDKILTNYFDDKDLWLASTLWLSSVPRGVPLNRFDNKTKTWAPIRELLNNS